MSSLRSLLRGQAEESGAFWGLLAQWWRGLDEDRGARARLRRAKRPLDVFVSPDFQRGLVAMLAEKGIALSPQDQEKLALGVGVLVHLDPPQAGQSPTSKHFARQLAPDEASKESVRDPRFRKLLTITELDDLFLMLRRLALYLERNVEGHVEWKSLVRGASDWTDQTRREWAIEYYVNRAKK